MYQPNITPNNGFVVVQGTVAQQRLVWADKGPHRTQQQDDGYMEERQVFLLYGVPPWFSVASIIRADTGQWFIEEASVCNELACAKALRTTLSQYERIDIYQRVQGATCDELPQHVAVMEQVASRWHQEDSDSRIRDDARVWSERYKVVIDSCNIALTAYQDLMLKRCEKWYHVLEVHDAEKKAKLPHLIVERIHNPEFGT